MNVQQLAPFSARNRGAQKPIDNDFPNTARIGLLHLLHDAVRSEYVPDDWRGVARELQRTARREPVSYTDDHKGNNIAQEDAQEMILSISWDRVLNFCERLHSALACQVSYWADNEVVTRHSRVDVQKKIAAELQLLFDEENLAFEFRDGAVFRKGHKHTIERITRAEAVMADARLDKARTHFAKAQRYFRDPTKPDPANVVKEAVCAVEAAARELFSDLKWQHAG